MQVYVYSIVKILVCVKQVPDIESAFRPASSGAGYDESGLVFRMNRYDEFACEEAVRLKESLAEVEITALTVGPERAGGVARRALEFGADHGVHVLAPDFPDAFETASLIASYARDKRFNLIFFGIMSEDRQASSVGPMAAAMLGIPCITAVIALEIRDNALVVEREIEGGVREIYQLPMPCALTVQSGINIPRYPTLTNKFRARKQELEIISHDRLKKADGRQSILKTYSPPLSGRGIVIEGAPAEKADKLVNIIHERTGLL